MPKSKTLYRAKVVSSIQGIPCLLGVTHYKYYKPNYASMDPYDYYGGPEYDYDVLDRKGYYAEWLRNKITFDDTAIIERDIVEHFDSGW